MKKGEREFSFFLSESYVVIELSSIQGHLHYSV